MIDSVIRELRTLATQNPTNPPLSSPLSNPQVTPKRVDLHYVLDLWLTEECPHCGHKLRLNSDIRVVNGYSYEKKAVKKPVAEKPPITENCGVIEL